MDIVYKALIEVLEQEQEHHEYIKEHKRFVCVGQKAFKPKTFKLI